MKKIGSLAALMDRLVDEAGLLDGNVPVAVLELSSAGARRLDLKQLAYMDGAVTLFVEEPDVAGSSFLGVRYSKKAFPELIVPNKTPGGPGSARESEK